MDFEQRLQKAIQRGQQQKVDRDREEAAREMTEEELRQTHTAARLELSEKIESGLRQIAEHFPGFRYQTLMGEDGWGARISRDDFGGRGPNLYSRMEMLVRPYAPDVKIVELVAKGTVRNKEMISRNHFQFLNKLDLESFAAVVEQWLLEFAERYAADT